MKMALHTLSWFRLLRFHSFMMSATERIIVIRPLSTNLLHTRLLSCASPHAPESTQDIGETFRPRGEDD